MILKYYGLREQPFGVAPNPRFIYQGPGHREALASLIYAIESNAGFAALIGRAGLGKTTLIFHLLDYFRQSARTAVVFNTQCSKGELLRYILAEFGETQLPSDVVLLYEHFRDILAREASQGRRVIIIIDEAQNLELEALEAVRLLNNFETPECKLLHIILVGQQQLAAKLMHPAMEQLLQRITIICRLAKFEDTQSIERYISHRLRTAGYDRPTPLFSADAISAILRESDGVPRRINRLCFNSMLLACALERMEIDGGIIEEVSRDLDLEELFPEESPAELQSAVSSQSKTPSQGTKAAKLFEIPVVKPNPAQSLPIAIGSSTVATYAGLMEAARTAQSPRTPKPAKVVERPPAPEPDKVRVEAEKPVADAKPVVKEVISGQPVVAEKPASSEKPVVKNVAPPTPLRIVEEAAAPRPVAIPVVATNAPKRPVHLPSVKVNVAVGQAPPKSLKKRKSPYRPLGSMSKIPVITALAFATLAAGAWFIAPGPLFRVHLRSSGTPAQEHLSEPTEVQANTEAQAQTASTRQIADLTPAKNSQPSTGSRNTTSRSTEDDDMEGALAFNIWPKSVKSESTSHSEKSPSTQDGPEEKQRKDKNTKIVHRVMPVYPADAEASQIQGRVVLRAQVGSDGRVSSVRTMEGPKLLADAAVDAVQQWTYQPLMRDGRSVDTEKKLIFNFKLRPK